MSKAKTGKAQSTIQRNLRELRKVVDETADPIESRIAYAMEHAIRWATLNTVGWSDMATEAKNLAMLLRDEIAGEARCPR